MKKKHSIPLHQFDRYLASAVVLVSALMMILAFLCVRVYSVALGTAIESSLCAVGALITLACLWHIIRQYQEWETQEQEQLGALSQHLQCHYDHLPQQKALVRLIEEALVEQSNPEHRIQFLIALREDPAILDALIQTLHQQLAESEVLDALGLNWQTPCQQHTTKSSLLH